MIRRLIILLLIVGCVFAREYIAIIDFEGINVSEGDAKALTQRLTSEMIKLEVYQVLERSEMKRLLEEQKFQYSGCVDLNCAVELGNMLGAKYMVVGSISKVGNTYSIDSRLIDVKTSESYVSANYDSSSEIDMLMKDGMFSIAHQLSEIPIESNNTVILSEEIKETPHQKTQQEKLVRIIKDSLTVIDFDLKPKYGTLIIHSDPNKTNSYLNNELIGKTPITKELITGSYKLKLQSENWVDEIVDISILYNETTTVDALLKKPIPSKTSKDQTTLEFDKIKKEEFRMRTYTPKWANTLGLSGVVMYIIGLIIVLDDYDNYDKGSILIFPGTLAFLIGAYWKETENLPIYENIEYNKIKQEEIERAQLLEEDKIKKIEDFNKTRITTVTVSSR